MSSTTFSLCDKPIIIGVTGAQGVGKSTFCRRLATRIRSATPAPVTLLNGLGESVRTLGYSVGSSSDGDSIAAVFAAHLRREADIPAGITLTDRCVIDALAYVRALRKTSPSMNALYEEVARRSASALSLVIHCKMSDTFLDSKATHETKEDRVAVAALIPQIISEFGTRSIAVDAASDADLEAACALIMML